MALKTKSRDKESGGRRAFKYRGNERTAEDVTRASKTSSSSFDSFLSQGVTNYKPRSGENNIRVLPLTWEDTDTWGKDWAIMVHIHYNVGSDKSAYLCLEKMKGEECPVCAAAAKAKDDDEKRELRVGKAALCYVIDRDNEKAGPQVWRMPLSVYRDIQTRSLDKRTKEVIRIDDPDEGYDISFNKNGEGIQTKYTGIEVARDSSPISDNEKRQARWLDTIVNAELPELLVFFDAEHIEKVLGGGSSKRKGDDIEDDDEDEAPRRSKGKAKRRDDDDEDESDEDTDDGNDDEEDEKPVRRSSKRARDEEDDDGDDDDTPPRRRSSKASEDDDEVEEDDEAEESDDEEDEDDSRTRRRGKSRDDDEDDAEEDDEASDDEEGGDDDEEEEEQPRRRSTGKGKARKSSDDDDDDNDDEGEDEEEDEKPAKSKQSASERAKAKLAEMKKNRGKRR